MNKHRIVYVFAFIVLIYALYSLTRIIVSLAPDFSVYYDAAKGLLNHKNIYTLHMYTGLGYPPFTLLVFIPFTLMPYAAAQVLWEILSFSLFLYCIYLSLLLVHKKSFYNFCIVFIFAFLAFPTKFTFGMGQINFLALTLLLMSLQFKSGLLLGASIITKPHLILFTLLINVREAVRAIGILVISALVTGVIFGFDLYTYYLTHTVPPLLEFTGREIYYNQGLGSFLARMLPNVPARNVTVWLSIALVTGGLWYIRRKKLPVITSVLISIPVFLLLEPLSWQHHYVFLLPVFVWLFQKTKLRGLLIISYILIAINIPHAPKIFLSHVFWGNLILLGLMVRETV